MPKHYTSPSANKKLYYAGGSVRILKNKIARLKKHLKRQPNDEQTREALKRRGH